MLKYTYSSAGEAGYGVWHKWERWYNPGELLGKNTYPNGTFGANIAYQMSVPCDPFSVYGCGSNELK